RITLGKIRLQRQPTLLAAIVRAVTEAHHEAIGVRRLSLSVDLPPAPVLVDADPTRLVQVVSNVVHNAVKFSPEGGVIEISASLDPSVNATAPLALVVRDSGIGISREMLPRVFDLFTQEDT